MGKKLNKARNEKSKALHDLVKERERSKRFEDDAKFWREESYKKPELNHSGTSKRDKTQEEVIGKLASLFFTQTKLIGHDKTKRGFTFLQLNDQTDDKRDEFYRKRGREPVDGELSTRVFISCPIEFRKLTQEFLTVENLLKIQKRTHFCFNGGIWKRPDLSETR